MRRLITLWLALLAAFWAVRTAISVLLFSRVDLGYEACFQLITIPALQAVALGWATRPRGVKGAAARKNGATGAALRKNGAHSAASGKPGASSAASGTTGAALPSARALARWRWLCLALVAEALVLALGWLPRIPSFLTLTARAALPAWCVAGLLLGAGVLLTRLAARRALLRLSERLVLGLLGALLCAVALEPLADWLGALPGLLPGTWRALFRVVASAVAVAAAAVLLLLEAQRALRRLSAEAARALDWALGFGLTALALHLLGPVLRPQAPEPMASLSATALGLAAAATLAAAVLAAAGRLAEE